MAILTHGSTIRTADGGQSTTTIVTASNIGTYGVAANSTYYVGTTQNVFNRASGAQTLTGVSIDGNAATVTNGVYTTGEQTIAGAKTFNSATSFSANAFLTGSSELFIGSYMSLQSSSTIMGMVGFNRKVSDGTIFNSSYAAYQLHNNTGTLNLQVYSSAGGFVGAHTFNSSGNVTFLGTVSAATDFRAPIFYDSGNTSYYLDPANTGTSLLVAGNVGIGTTTPAYKLDVNTANDSAIRIRNGAGSANNGLALAVGSGTPWFDITEGAEFRIKGNTYANLGTWNSGNNTKLLINSSGNVGIGTASPSQKLHVVGTAYSDTDFRAPIFYDSNNTAYYLDPANTGTSLVVAGNVGIGTTTPSYKFEIGAGSTGNVVAKLTQGYEKVRYYGFDLLGYNDGNLWMIGNNATNGLILGSNWDWDAQAGIYYTPGTYGAAGGSLEIGQLTKNNANFTHGNTRFYTNGTEKMRIISNGNVGIGTQTPAYKLDVNGAINSSTYVYAGVFYDNDNTAYYANPSGASIFNGLKLVSSGNEASGSDYSLWIQGGNEDWGIGIDKSANNYGITYNLASSHTYAIQGRKNGTEYFRLGTDMLSHDTRLQAPIFYDSNDTTYYIDPASTSRIVALWVRGSSETVGNIYVGGTAAGDRLNINYDQIWTPNGNLHLQYSGGGNIDMNFGGGHAFSRTSLRAPIFYDFNNTSYYLDPNSGSNLYDLTLSGAHHVYLTINPGNGYEAMVRYIGGTGSSWYVGKRTSAQLVGTANFHFYSEAAGATVGGIDTSGNIYSIGSVRSPIFYDSDNTAYYIDAASTSNLNALIVAASTRIGGAASRSTSGLTVGFTDNSTFAANTDVGDTDRILSIVNESSTTNAMAVLGFRVNPNGGTANAMLDIKFVQTGATNTSALHYTFNHGGSFADRFSILSNGNIGIGTTSPYGKIDLGSSTGAKLFVYGNGGNVEYITGLGTDLSGSSALSFFTGVGRFEWLKGSGNYPYSSYAVQATLDASSNFIVTSSVRTPIFYDSDNTAYYINAASTSSLNALNLADYVDVGTYIYLRNNLRMLNSASNGWIETIVRNSGSPYFTNPIDGGTFLASDGAENNNWLFQENARGWGLFYFNRGTQSGQTFGSYTTVGAETFIIGQGSGTTMTSTWTGYNASSKVAIMLSNYTGYIWANDTIFSATGLRAPIFYDSDDTNFYANPAGESKFNYLRLTNNNALYFTTTGVAELNNEGNSTNVAFRMIKSGSSNADGNNYGVLNLQRTNHTNGATNAGASIFFELKDSGGTIREYAGLSGCKTEAGAAGGRLIFHRYARTEIGYWDADQLFANASMRSPIFYDSGNTAYYLDAASTSNLVGLTVANTITGSITGSSVFVASLGSGLNYDIDRTTKRSGLSHYSGYSTGTNRPTTYDYTLQVTDGGKGWEISMDWISTAGPSIYARSLRDCCQNWSSWVRVLDSVNYAYAYNMNQNVRTTDNVAFANVTGAIFYDAANTAYYVDPASSSVLNFVRGTNFYDGTGTYNVNLGSGNTEGRGLVAGYSGGSYGGIGYNVRHTTTGGSWIAPMADTSTYLLFSNGVYFYYAAGGTAGRTLSYSTIGSLTSAGIFTVSGDSRAPLFYDSNDTNYYVDPASASRLNNLTVVGTMTFGTLAYTTESRRSKNSSNVDIETVTGLVSPSGPTFLEIRGFCPPTMYRTTGDRPAPYGLGFGNGSESGGIMPIGAGDNLQEIMLYGSNTGPTTFTFKRQNWEGSTYDASNSNIYSASVFSINTGTGAVTASTDIRSPIYYDQNNTAYYTDPASTSVLNRIDLPSGSATINTTTPGQTVYQLNFTGQSTNDNAQAITWGWSTSGAQAGIYVQSSGGYGTKMYIATTDSFATGSKTALTIDHTGIVTTNRNYLQATGSVRAPIFYDSDNTGYYIDAAGASSINTVTSAQYYTTGWFRNNSSGNGLYNESTGEHFYSDASDMWNIASAQNTQGIRFRTGGHNGTIRGYIYADNGNNIGLLNNGGNWRARVVGGDYFLADGSSIRGQIFYDSNDTGYYVDPNGTTVLNTLYTNSYANLSNDYKDILVYGDVNTYYVVLIGGESVFSFKRYGITRGYSWTGPDTWNTATHKAGLTLDFEWSGDVAWGGNDHAIRVIEFNETYANTVGGMAYPVTGGVIVWLRGGGVNGAQYRIRTPIGGNATVTVYDGITATNHSSSTSFTAGDSTVYSTRANNSNISSEIYSRYPVRALGSLYNDGNGVVDTGGTAQTKSGYLQSNTSLRAPIFYDSDNTGYYVDPNSTSNLVGLTVANTITGSVSGNAATATTLQTARNINGTSFNGSAAITTATWGTARTLTIGATGKSVDGSAGVSWSLAEIGALPISGGTITGAISTNINGTSIFIGNQNVSTSNALRINWHTDSDLNYYIGKRGGAWTQPMDITFYTGLRYHAHRTYNAHIFYVTGYDSTEAFSIGKGDDHVRVNNNLYAPIMYDLNNTAYYVDPASTSVLNTISLQSNITHAGNAYIQTTTTGTSYTSHFQVREASGGYGNTNEIYAPSLGFHWSGVVASNILMESSGRIAIRNNPGSGYENFIANIVYGNSSVQTPIVYDSNDTAYYVDAASTSNLLLVRTRNTFGERVAVSATASTTINTQYNVTELTLAATITTLTLSNIQASGIVHMWTIITVGGGVPYSITWPAAVKWPGGTAPTLTTSSSKRDIYQFVTYDGGTNIYAIIVGQNL